MKRNRQEKIIDLINKHNVETQEQLASLLKGAGYDVTQATVSRDIRALQLTKVTTRDGNQHYAMPEQLGVKLQDKYIRVLQNSFVSMEQAENILVLKTYSGMAMAAAAALDALKLESVAGIIAGDDTIFAAIRTVGDTERVMASIRELIDR